jgi:hypothetical protein
MYLGFYFFAGGIQLTTNILDSIFLLQYQSKDIGLVRYSRRIEP